MLEPVLIVAGRSYAKVYPGVYEIPASAFGDLRMGEIPAHSTVKVIDLPIPPPDHEFYLTVTNGGDEGDDEYLTVFGSAAFETEVDAIRRMNRIRRTYLPFVERGDLPEAFVPPTRKGESSRGASFSIDLAGQPDRLVREAIRPVLAGGRRVTS